ncbi:hypothetical protein [Saccharicrinis sp. FJH54]|uniref:hypothetical protein n=1 Tax=Saccharicrinis sp. FJH54 TaxID=3344665 RepID=UPI0035D49D8A
MTKKQMIKSLAKIFTKDQKEFDLLHKRIIRSFNLNEEQKTQVQFGIIVPADKSLQNFNNKLNSHKELIHISEKLQRSKFTAYQFFLTEFHRCGVHIPDIDIEKLQETPEESVNELEIFFSRFVGQYYYRINDKRIIKELPLRKFLERYPDVRILIDIWFRKTKQYR